MILDENVPTLKMSVEWKKKKCFAAENYVDDDDDDNNNDKNVRGWGLEQ